MILDSWDLFPFWVVPSSSLLLSIKMAFVIRFSVFFEVFRSWLVWIDFLWNDDAVRYWFPGSMASDCSNPESPVPVCPVVLRLDFPATFRNRWRKGCLYSNAMCPSAACVTRLALFFSFGLLCNWVLWFTLVVLCNWALFFEPYCLFIFVLR